MALQHSAWGSSALFVDYVCRVSGTGVSLFEFDRSPAYRADMPPAAPTGAARDRLIVTDHTDVLRKATICLVGTSVIIGIIMIAFVDVRTDFMSLSAVAETTAALLLASAALKRRGRLERLETCFGAQGMTWLAGFAGGVIALAGLRMQFPLRDESLYAIDHALGLDGPTYVGWASHAPAMITQAVGGSYTSTLGILLLSITAQALLGARLEVWRATFCFTGTLVTTCLISIIVPAKGVALWVADDVLARLPEEAGRYFWPGFERFYSGKTPIIHLNSIDAVVSFPSFHFIMGMIVLFLWRDRVVAFGIAMVWFVLMVSGTVPLGGHYFVDLIGGFVVWSAWFWLSTRLAGSEGKGP